MRKTPHQHIIEDAARRLVYAPSTPTVDVADALVDLVRDVVHVRRVPFTEELEREAYDYAFTHGLGQPE